MEKEIYDDDLVKNKFDIKTLEENINNLSSSTLHFYLAPIIKIFTKN
jgi:hypothetical protein